MDKTKHLSKFKVQNFKCFSDFTLDDIGQFNIILGENNVGKTSLLEALLFNEESYLRHIVNLLVILGERHFFGAGGVVPNNGDFDLLLFFLNSQSENKSIKYELHFNQLNKPKALSLERIIPEQLNLSENEILNKKFKINRAASKVFKSVIDGKINFDYFANVRYSEINEYLSYVWVNLGYEKDIAEFFSANIASDKVRKETFFNNLKLFIPELENIELSLAFVEGQTHLAIWLKGQNSPMPLPSFGEGTIKLFRILTEIAMCEGSRLHIDEIDTGIHYSKFKEYWKTILKASDQNNVQLFSTTHSLECLKYYTQALNDEECKQFRERARIFTLVRNKEGEIQAIPYRFEQFENAINNDIEIRK